MGEVKEKIEAGKTNREEEGISYTLRGIPAYVHDKIGEFKREISYKRNTQFNIEQSYVEALKDWADSRKDLQKVNL